MNLEVLQHIRFCYDLAKQREWKSKQDNARFDYWVRNYFEDLLGEAEKHKTPNFHYMIKVLEVFLTDKVTKKLDELENLYYPMKQFFHFFVGFDNENKALKEFPSLIKIARAANADPIREHWSEELCDSKSADELEAAIKNLRQALKELGDL